MAVLNSPVTEPRRASGVRVARGRAYVRGSRALSYETLEQHYLGRLKAHLTYTSCNECAAWDRLEWQVLNRSVCGEISRTCPFPVQSRLRLRRTQHTAG